MPAVRQNRSKLAVTFSQAVSMPDATIPDGMLSFFMALPSFVVSTPRAYKLKAGNADLRYFNMLRDIPKRRPASTTVSVGIPANST